MRVGVCRQHAAPRSFANGAGAPRRQPLHLLGDFVARSGDEYLDVGIEKRLEPFPGVGDETRTGAGRLEHACRRREAVAGHAVAADVQHRQRRAVERVVIGRVEVTDRGDVRRLRLVVPAVTGEQEPAVVEAPRRPEEEVVDARLAIRQPIAEERDITREPRIRRHGIVRRRIERVVDRDALARADRLVGRRHGIAAAVGEDAIVLADEGVERIGVVVVQPIERRRRVDVPEDRHRARLPFEPRLLELAIEHADAAGLDDDVGAARRLDGAAHRLLVVRVDDDPRPGRIVYVAMDLPLVGVRLVERNIAAKIVQRPQQPAVVGGRAVPVRRHEARSEEGDLHGVATSISIWLQMAVSSSTRWPQVWRAVTVARPCRASASRSAWLATSRARWAVISAPSRATRKSFPAVNRSAVRSHLAAIIGMPHASASNGRIVGTPGSDSRYGRRGMCKVTLWRAKTAGTSAFGSQPWYSMPAAASR